MRGVWIEMEQIKGIVLDYTSLPMRGVWIEIATFPAGRHQLRVTPHAGSVD